MSDSTPFGFGKFVPGFDFLQNLAQGTAGSIPKIPSLSNWVAPTLSVEELDKRIEELKAVQFWLEQNSRALTATVQALEVQKMTLATLKGMNVSMTDMAAAFAPKASAGSASKTKELWPSAAPAAPAAPAAASEAAAPAAAPASAPSAGAAGAIDPMQWWGALTQQFQQIATSALQEASKQAALAPAQNLATGAQDAMKDAMKAATDMATQGVQTLQSAARSATRAPAAGKASAAAKPAAKAAAPSDDKPAAKKSSPRRAAKPASR